MFIYDVKNFLQLISKSGWDFSKKFFFLLFQTISVKRIFLRISFFACILQKNPFHLNDLPENPDSKELMFESLHYLFPTYHLTGNFFSLTASLLWTVFQIWWHYFFFITSLAFVLKFHRHLSSGINVIVFLNII